MRARKPLEWAKRNSTDLIRVGVVLLFLGSAMWALYLNFRYGEYAWIVTDSAIGRFLASSLISIGPELAGIVIGVVTIDYLNERRQNEMLKKQLILQMGSKHPDVADTAIKALSAYGWLYDGSLRGCDFDQCDYGQVDLQDANLKYAHFCYTNLKGAYLGRANLEGAVLDSANLEGAYLGGACLKGAALREANLAGANLYKANLEQATMWGANLKGIRNYTVKQLSQADSLEGATMPDGTRLRNEGDISKPTFEKWAEAQKG